MTWLLPQVTFLRSARDPANKGLMPPTPSVGLLDLGPGPGPLPISSDSWTSVLIFLIRLYT